MISPVEGVAVEIYAWIVVGRGRIFPDLLADPDGLERTGVTYDPGTCRLSIDRSMSSRWSEAIGGIDWGTLTLGPGEPLELRVFVDNSIVELFEFTSWPLRLDAIASAGSGRDARIDKAVRPT